MEISEEFYLENRKMTTHRDDLFCFENGVSVTFDEIRESIDKAEKKLEGKEGSDMWFMSEEYDGSGKCYLAASWLDWETKEEFEQRMWQNKWAKERAVNSLKTLITKNPLEAIEIIKELNLI